MGGKIQPDLGRSFCRLSAGFCTCRWLGSPTDMRLVLGWDTMRDLSVMVAQVET